MDSVIPSAPAKSTKVDFDWADPFALDNQLSSEDRLVRDTAKAYAEDKLAPRVIEAFREEKTDTAIFSEMGELGLLGITVDEKYGGVGASHVTYGLVAREIEKIDSGYSQCCPFSPL
ncbi:MAG: hypothetical protein CM15mP80_04220 [Alphaproteobacteria bacterium]|nr:MAG: hypothetical protein CM15mP80_04220 [Alphaproteobacteria bacterium]